LKRARFPDSSSAFRGWRACENCDGVMLVQNSAPQSLFGRVRAAFPRTRNNPRKKCCPSGGGLGAPRRRRYAAHCGLAKPQKREYMCAPPGIGFYSRKTKGPTTRQTSTFPPPPSGPRRLRQITHAIIQTTPDDAENRAKRIRFFPLPRAAKFSDRIVLVEWPAGKKQNVQRPKKAKSRPCRCD